MRGRDASAAGSSTPGAQRIGLGRGVLEDVAELALAGLRVDGHRGDAGEERADDGHGRLGRRHRPHADALGARHLARDVGGRVAQLRVRQLHVAEAQGEAVVGVAQRGEEHVRDPSMHARRRGHRLRRPRGPAPRRAPRPRAGAGRGRRAHPRGERQPDRPRASARARRASAHARPAAAVRAGLGPGRRGDRGGQRGERLRPRRSRAGDDPLRAHRRAGGRLRAGRRRRPGLARRRSPPTSTTPRPRRCRSTRSPRARRST